MSVITKNIENAIETLQLGEVVAIPTETVYGLAGNANSETAIKKIYTIKNRPLTHPLIMHINKDWDITTWVREVPDYAQKLMDTFWPGPLTLVFQAKPKVINPLVTAGQDTVALRCPKHPVAERLLERLAFPLVAPSANPFGKISPTTAQHVQESFPQEKLLILDGGRCPIGIESTIVAATNPRGYHILRQGMIDEKTLQTLLPGLALPGESLLRAPGRSLQHYQPEKPLYGFENMQALLAFVENHRNTYVLSFSECPSHCGQQVQLPADPSRFAYELYYELRAADASETLQIAIELPPNTALWKGIRERLLKAIA